MWPSRTATATARTLTDDAATAAVPSLQLISSREERWIGIRTDKRLATATATAASAATSHPVITTNIIGK